ncbi:MAG: acyl-CoA mutase large subunit family protein, partial [Sciscionella sp.]
WTLRNIVGYGTPSDTRDGIEKARAAGSPGVDVVLDTLSQEAIDPDHPSFSFEVGKEGCTLACVSDLEELLKGIDVTETDIAWHATVLLYPMLAALARRRGLPLDRLLGSHMPDHVQLNLTGYGERIMPVRLAHRASIDCLEYVARHSPRWALGFPQAYNMRERGLTPATEIAVGMAIVNQTLTDLAQRGMPADDIAPSLAWVSTSDIDLFEEVAKYRALRRIWARTLAERFGAKDPRSLRLRIACHTSGRSLTYQQPYNNIARATVQTLAAILGGVQSVETCTYDEPISIPTHEARELAIRTQQILAHEVGAARTADPLGGSWYVEALTDEVEAAALGMLGQIEEMGLLTAVESGWLEDQMDDVNARAERELAEHSRIIVGVNAFGSDTGSLPPRFDFDKAPIAEHVREFTARKVRRDHDALRTVMSVLYDTAAAGENCVGAMVDAFELDATIGEVWGTFRTALGYSYDPFGVLRSPFGDQANQ